MHLSWFKHHIYWNKCFFKLNSYGNRVSFLGIAEARLVIRSLYKRYWRYFFLNAFIFLGTSALFSSYSYIEELSLDIYATNFAYVLCADDHVILYRFLSKKVYMNYFELSIYLFVFHFWFLIFEKSVWIGFCGWIIIS